VSAPLEPGDPKENELAERLLEYDAALASGDVSPRMKTDDLSDDFREGFSCLEMLERLRLSDQISHAFSLPNDQIPQALSFSNAPAMQLGPGPNEDTQVPAHLGRFQILNLIGQGGCGVVFLAHDPALSRHVAIKIPRPEALLTPELRQRFLREGRAAACLDHPNITTVFEAGEYGAVCYLASAYCSGISLREWLRHRGGPQPPRAAAKLVATLADAMAYAHRNGVCHRDLKPSNILLQIPNQEAGAKSNLALYGLESAVPTIIDFGLAKVFHGDSGEAGTRSGAVFGTPQYMAPEQAQGQTQAIGPATDIHALGVILYELLTGRLPYQGDTDLKILSQLVTGVPGSPRRLCPQVPRDLETICLKCLEKQPENRYGSMTKLGEDLHCYLEGRPIQVRPSGWAARSVKWVRRHPRATATGTLISALAVTVLTGLIWITNRESAHSADLERASQEIGLQKARAEKQDWLARNQEYAVQIRAGWLLKNEGKLAELRDALVAQKSAANEKDLRGFEWHYLWGSVPGLKSPESYARVTAIAYSHNGELCAAGDADGGINLFSTRTGRPLTRLRGHSAWVNRLDFLDGDTQLLSTVFNADPDRGTFRSEFILWSLGDQNKVLRRGDYSFTGKVFGHPNFALAPDAHTLFIIRREGSQHQLLRLDLETGRVRTLLTSERLCLVATTHQADRVALVLNSDYVEIIDPATMKRISCCRFTKLVHTAEFSPDGKMLALGVGWEDGSPRLELRDAASLRLLRSFQFGLVPNAPRFDWQGRRLAVTTGQERFHLFNVQTGETLGSFKDDGAKAMTLAFSPDGEEMAVGTADGRVRTGKQVFDPQDYSLPGPLPKSEAWCLAFSPDGSTLAVGYDHRNGSEQQTLRLWDLTTKKAKSLPGHDETVMALAISPNGKTLATASHDQTVRLWDMPSGRCLHQLQGHINAVRALAFSPDGQRFASAGSDLSIKTWNVSDGAIGASWLGHSDLIRSLAFSPDSNMLVSAALDRTIKIWDARDGTLVRAITDESKVQSVVCSPDGSLLASGNENNKVELWQLGAGTLWKSLLGHTGRVRAVAFSPEGKTLATGGEDKTVRLWNVVTGEELLVFPTEHFVNSLAFHPRKPILAAALHNGTVKIWSGE
jgi:WD40 repeat protein